MALAVLSPFLPSMIAGDGYIPFGLELLGPVVLGTIGAVVALLHRSLAKSTRISWAAASFLTGLIALPLLLGIAYLIEGVSWSINGPPPGL